MNGVPVFPPKVTVGGARSQIALNIAPPGGTIESVELEIVTSAIYAPSPVKYDFYAANGVGYAELATGRKLATIVLGPDNSSRVIKIPISPEDIREGAGGEAVLQVGGVLSEGGSDSYIVPIYGLVRFSVTATNIPIPEVSYRGTNVVVAGSSPITLNASARPCAEFQWQLNGRDIPGSTGPDLFLPTMLEQDEGTYSVVMRNSFGAVTSVVMTLSVQTSAPKTLPEQSASASLGGRWEHCLFSEAAPRGTIHWLHNGIVLPNQFDNCISIDSIRADQAGVYTMVERNDYGAATNSVRLTVVEAAPVLWEQPRDITITQGATVNFQFGAYGGPPPQFYLQRNGTNWPLPGLILYGATTNDSGSYRNVASNVLGTATSKGASFLVLPAGPLDQWTERNPLPQVNTVLSLAAGKGVIVGVGEGGALLISNDGKAWRLLNRLTQEDIETVVFAADRFVAAGQNGTLIYSTDGENWERGFVENTDFRGVTYGNGVFLMVADNGLFRSADGIHWEKSSSLSPARARGIAYGNGVFVAAGRGLWTSSNGADWQQTLPSNELEAVVFQNGLFMAAGNNGTIMASPDGLNWTTQRSGTLLRLYDVTYGNGKYVCVGARGIILVSSNNGAIWEPVPSGTPDRMESIIFRDGLFVAAGENGTTILSTNGMVWGQEKRGTTLDLDGMVISDRKVVVVGKAGTILTSTNGIDFEQQQSGTTNNLHGVTWSTNNLYVAVGEPGVILTSPDAVQWTARNSGVTTSLKRALFANNLWVTVGTEGTIVVSAEGTSWTSLPRVTFDDLNEIAYGNGTFVIVGDNFQKPDGTILLSTNGLTWVDTTVQVGKNVRSVTFADNRFVAGVNDGLVLSSPDGITWTTRFASVRNLRDVNWDNGLWMAVGNGGEIVTSSDAVNWRRRTTRARENLHEVGFFNGRWITIGNRGTVLQSGAAAEPIVVASIQSGGVSINVVGSGKLSELQKSDDLRTWIKVADFNIPDFVYTIGLPSQGVSTTRTFYRVRQSSAQ